MWKICCAKNYTLAMETSTWDRHLALSILSWTVVRTSSDATTTSP